MMKYFCVIFVFLVIFSSCSKPPQTTQEASTPENIYSITVNNNQVGYEEVIRDRVGDTLVITSFQTRPYRLRPIDYDAKLILVPGYASWKVANYRCYELLPGQKITFKLRFDEPWIILLQNSVISSPRYWNSDPKDPDGPAVVEWDRAFLLEALLNRYNINDTAVQRVQDVPVLIPSAFGEWGNVSIELNRVVADTAFFTVIYHREIAEDSIYVWSEDSVVASLKAIMPLPGVIGELLQARVNLPSGIVISIFQEPKAKQTLGEPRIREPEVEGYGVAEDTFSGSDGVKLVGSFYIPTGEGVFPGILLIPTNVACDRYEMGVFRYLAHHLAKSGYLVFTYDKRGVGSSQGNYDSLHYGLISGDAYLALENLLTHGRLDKNNIFVLGHGEGALVALDIASDPQFRSKLAGVISMGATSLNPIDEGNVDLLTLQAETWGWSEQRLEKQIEDLKAGIEYLRSSSEFWREIPGFPGEKENLAYARSFLDFDPLAKIRQITLPVLILHGQLDRFVDPDNAQRLHQAAPNSKVVILPGIDANFAFTTIEGRNGFRETFLLPEDYGAELSVSDTIITWLNSVVR
ncbi:MAG: hypothetical protein APR63_05610 [Desulfuromonas sp. SDB]|nr:MAG: hypothetical protein APR63_05610 [Desulfuromonas sp. SDB]